MILEETSLPGVVLLKPKVFGDARGFFLETYNKKRFLDTGINTAFVQDNHSRSFRNVLRGLHYQLNHPQGKLVYVTHGSAFDVAVDIRRESETYGQWYGVELNDENHFQLYIPPGYAHGFCALSDVVDFNYKCTDIYHPEDEYGIIWNDPTINVAWPVSSPVLSNKDKQFPPLDMIASKNLPT